MQLQASGLLQQPRLIEIRAEGIIFRMRSEPVHPIKFWPSLAEWWRDRRARHSFVRTAGELVGNLWEFMRNSTPEQRRRRFGDIDFDWENRVNTTSGTVSWRDRLVGAFTSGYQPTEPALFHEMLGSLPIDFRSFTFVDLGSGKGRALLLASDYPFRRIVGVELIPGLHRAAQKNLSTYKSDTQKCFAIESTCGDVREFSFPKEPLLIYLFNPFPESILEQVIANLERSLAEHPRPIFIVYHNPALSAVVVRSGVFARIGGSHQYSLLANQEGRRLMEQRS
jgi:SAM-dependent methyltransferase